MKNVICMRTKKEVESLPYDKEQAEQLIAHIMKFKAPASIADSYSFMFETVIRQIVNNSGANMDSVQEIVSKSKKKAKGA